MATRVRSVDFLPEIFQTPVNKQFLASTLDQLVQEPQFSPSQGYIGRRIGPGVNANDKYVVEPDANRANYQLEPAVVFKKPDTETTQDLITYPGIVDTLELKGAKTNRADRLWDSQYYCWDPFIDFDKMINFSEYYWVPAGPNAVQVSASTLAAQTNIEVYRENGYYRFLGTQGSNPTLTLIRGLSYNFNVTQNLTTTFNYRVTNRGSQAYVIDFANNPTLTLIRGNTYQFNIVTSGDFPFWIKNIASTGTANAYNRGVTNNGARSGLVTFKVPYDAPDTLYYTSETSQFMQGQFNISDPKSGTGPGFWIQVDPGADGRIAATPNINGRDVLGVVNNGEDFGTVTFNVPSKTAQNFYYTLPEIPAVDLVCDLKFDQVNGTYVEDFIEQYGGIDGTTDLEFKTIVFPAQNRVLNTDDALVYGWVRNFPYSPFPTPEPEYVGQPGSYDIPDYSEAVPLITKTDRYQVFQILYRKDLYGATYIELVDFRKINKFEKFFVLSGDVYANTQWYKNAEEYLEKIPLLSAVLDTLFYQDGADPNQYGQIRLIEQNEAETLFISDILGKKNYISPNGVVFTNGLKVQFRNSVVPQSYANNTYYVEGVGTAIQLLPTENFISPEPFTTGAIIPFDSLPFDVGNYDADQNQPLIPDYLTINRSSQDLNAWSRSNRWFHRQVLEQTAAYTGQVADLNQDLRAKRPILEFRGGTKLYNFGTQAKLPINIIDFNTTDAFSTINGQPQYNIDGYNLQTGSRVIFANDSDPLVRGRVYEVTMIDPDTQQPLIDQPIINLTLAEDGIPEYNDTVVCVNGITLQGTSYWFNGLDWQLAQLKTQLNQQPLFDVFDLQGYSFGDVARYPSSSFSGTKIFSYARGTGANDPYLNFPIQYLTINNVGDIVFDNNFYTDSFLYVVNRASQTKMVSDGFVRQYQDRTNFVNEIGWQPARSNARPYQQFRFNYDGSPLLLDVRVEDVSTNTNLDTSLPPLKVYAGNRFVPPTEYQYTRTSNTTTILLRGNYNQGDVIEVLAYSDQVSAVAFYEIPTNLENNSLNQNSSTFTLGTVRRHYDSIGTNLLNLLGPINGSNNSRDLGNLVPYGGEILQQSSPMPLVGYFLRDTTVDVFDAIAFNGNEYQKFKDILMETVAGLEYNDQTPAELLTLSIGLMTQGKNNLSPFYWSDMLPATTLYEETLYTFTAISTQVFDTVQSYDYTSSNYRALNVYVNDVLLTIGVDYIVNSDALTVTITRDLEVGDVIKLQEFANTLGNYVPNTPTKIGLYPAYRPRMYLDTTYQVPTMVILGHDGSKTVAFEDIRDQVLLEFETRIYNNLKIHSKIPITPVEVIPSFFEPTSYTDREIQSILDTSFLTWVGANRLGYTTQDYVQDNPFTWNYSRAGNKLTGTPLKGAWRGIYLDFYNTISPNLTPWEMLGLTQEPSWWQNRYGPAPYTSGNLVLWDDLEAGRIAEPGNDRIDPRYARPGLTQILPVDDQGRLLSPFESIVGAYDPTGFQASWRTGDYGPVEYSWRVSSIYPFALMRLYALTRPAEFFNEFADRDLYQYNSVLDQYLYQNRYRLGTNLEIYGQGQSKASYINWIVDFSIWAGDLSAPNTIATDISNIDARLAYRMAGYSDKNYIDLFLEKPTPASSNTSLMLPDESYDLLLYKNQQSDALIYSAVIIQRVAEGYQIFGYSEFKPFFPVLVSRPLGKTKTFIVAGTNTRVPVEYTDEVVEVPYGYVFTNRTVVADFLLSYGQVLQRQGMIFDTVENGSVMNWDQMVEEFLYWSNQGWAVNSIIAINPVASVLKVNKPGYVVNDISATSEFEQIIDQNREPIDLKNCVIRRFGNDFELTSTNEQSISYVTLSFTQYEHAMVLRNSSVFGDLIYNPITGARQSRILFNGFLTDEWDGTVDAQGFILNLDNVEEWRPNLRYTKGQIVKFKNNYWSALGIVQPSRQFNQNEWVQSDYEAIQKGLLPNLPNKANQLANSYNINSANLENDNDLLSYGLIGFRPRQYMAALDLNDISQVNVYQQFLKNKGTVQSVRLISDANLGKESAEYDIYENWAILAGTYGAQYNRRYIDLQLNKALLNSNPSLVQLIDIGGSSIADQPIVVNQVFSSSSVVNTPNVLPTIDSTITYSLPTAGYVNEEDVDVSTYSLDQASDLNPFLDQLGIGKTVWVAKTNAYEWNVYRCNGVPGQIVVVTDNLDGTSTVLFNTQHELTPGRLLIIKNFDSQINGCYRVLLVPSLYTVVIEFSFESGSAIEAVGEGVGLVLDSTRVSQPSGIANLDFANSIRPGAKVWVDNNGDNKWTVLEKTNPTVFNAYITPRLVDGLAEPNTRFATSIDQRQDNLMALIGRPDFDFDRGQVVNYIQNNDPGTPDYVPGQTMDLHGAIGLKNYGWSVDIGLNTWAAAGAPNSGDKPGIGKLGYVGVSAFNGLTTSFEETQLLLPLDVPGPCEFGYSVAMSRDERWLYIGAPLNNSVYVYGKQDVQAQAVEYFAQLGQSTFSTGNIQFTNDKQLLVTRNGKEQVLGYNYFVNGTSVIFYTAASIGEYITIARRSSILLDSEMFPNQTQSKTTGFGVNAVFDIRLTRGKYEATIIVPGNAYSVGEIITIPGTRFGGKSPLNDCRLEVTQIEGPGNITGVSATGSFIPLSGLPKQFYLDEYLNPIDDTSSVMIYVDGRLMRPKIDYEIIYSDSSLPDSSASDHLLVFGTPYSDFVPGFGAHIVAMNGDYYRYVDKLQVPGLAANARFGHAVSSSTDGRMVLVGAPNATHSGEPRAGLVYVFDRYYQRFQVTDANVTTYDPLNPIIQPVNVKQNNTFLTNTIYYNNGTFTDNGTTITVNAPIQVGDSIDIETNQFVLLQTISAHNSQLDSAFGASLDLCRYNCSLYIGQPTYSQVEVPKAGSVDRWVNKPQFYGTITGTVQNPSLVAGDTLRVNGFEIEVPSAPGINTAVAFAAAITAQVPNVRASVSNGYFTINVINLDAATPGNRLTVLPGAVGTVFTDIGFELFAYTQTLEPPVAFDGQEFGREVNIDTSATILTVGTPFGTIINPVQFDAHRDLLEFAVYQSPYVLNANSPETNPTTFDSGSTTFFDPTVQSGVVYTYNYLTARSPSVTNPGLFVLGEQIRNDNIQFGDQFGTSISYKNNVLLIGAPGADLVDDSSGNEGAFLKFSNVNNVPAWTPISTQAPVVNVNLINSVSMYDAIESTTNQFFDFFNPLLGKVLGAVQSNLDYVSITDPAIYNTTNTPGQVWSISQEGKIWWDTSMVRFIDTSAGDIKYAANRWGQVFPGSAVQIYQWTRSSEPPSQYTGPGVPYDLEKYTIWSELNTEGIIEPVYFFWVTGITTVAKKIGKTLSPEVIARYIEEPKSSGISFVAPISPSCVAIYNGLQYVKAQDTILHIEYDLQPNDANVHQEYELVAEEQVKSFINDRLYEKLLDSFAGETTSGIAVPDPSLPPAMRYGVQFNPRQSMFENRFVALQNYIDHANTVMATYPLSENRRFSILNSSDPEPLEVTGAWDKRVLNLEQLGWQDIYIVPLGYTYLVATDSSNSNLWTIYTVVEAVDGSRILQLSRVQSWDVRKYWNYVNWYAIGFDPATQIVTEVPLYADLSTLTVPIGSAVKVTTNTSNKWEIYQYDGTTWNRVALQDGTIQISPVLYDYALGRFGFDGEVFDAQYFDQTPQVETRKIIEALNQEIFVDDLAIERNRLLILMFNYIISEQRSPTWLIKTSLIDVTHKIRELLPYQTYRRDNQDFVLQYINEVKPYHVQIRQFNLQYSGQDEFFGELTDYDLPAYYDTSVSPPQFVSPILVDMPPAQGSGMDGQQLAVLPNPNTDASLSTVGPDAAIWSTFPYNQWYNNFLLDLESIEIIDQGANYLFPPTVTLSGVAKRLGTLEAVINSAGQVIAINIVDPGEGYYLTPTVNITSVSGGAATAVARMTNTLVRTFNTTLNFDRYQYQPNFVPWMPNDTFDNGTLVEYDGRVWEANSPDSTGVNTPTFEPSDWILVPQDELSGVDRTMAYYVATNRTPGKKLPLLISGVDYPGVIVDGVAFDAATGFDSDPYDTYVFDNIQVSPEGTPTYSDRILDTIYSSTFLDQYLGTRPNDVNVEGGAFIDTYSSHAPEELVPGSEFDTLDFRVYTTPGADWLFDGHGWEIDNRRYEADTTTPELDFNGLLEFPVAVQVTNVTTRRDLNIDVDFVVDWPNLTVQILQNVNVGDALMLRAFELGGGNQLYRSQQLGGTFGNRLIIPVQFSLIQELAVFVNGEVYTDFTFSQLPFNQTQVDFDTTFTNLDFVSLTAIGVSPGTVVRSWSKPMTQTIVVTNASQLSYPITLDLEGTNAANILVVKNGVRARPYQCVSIICDGSSDQYFLPTRNGISQGLISDPDVTVYLDNQLQSQLGDYVVDPWDGSSLRLITFLNTPPIGSRLLICVSTKSDYVVSAAAEEITFRTSGTFGLAVGDVIELTTWNDTSQQDLVTMGWQGPVVQGTTVVEPFDSTPFAYGVFVGEPGTFDYSAPGSTTINDLDLNRPNVDPTRLWVTLNGNRLVNNVGFSVAYQNGTSYLILPNILGSADYVAVTMPTDSVVPESMAFRIFQDMRGVQTVHRITPSTTTTVAQFVYADADTIYLTDASRVGEPNIANNSWGIITINAERIMYRYRDLSNNSISGLMRGTGGTAIAEHAVDSIVYDMSSGTLLPPQYQDYVVLTAQISDGKNNVFVAPNLSLEQIDSSLINEGVVRVTVGGITLTPSQYDIITDDPISVQLYTTPPAGVEVVISELRGVTWYAPGINTASNGRPLQETNTEPARFLRGL